MSGTNENSGEVPHPILGQATTPPSSGTGNPGPINLDQIRRLRMAQMAQSQSTKGARPRRGQSPAASRSPGDAGEVVSRARSAEDAQLAEASSDKAKEESGGSAIEQEDADGFDSRSRAKRQERPAVVRRVEVPNVRRPLTDDLASEFEAAMMDADLDRLLVGDKLVQVGVGLEDGQRYRGTIIKIHQDNVFVSLGGPNEGVVPLLHFNETPVVGSQLDFVVRAFNREDGLYELSVPGEAIAVSDWEDMEEGSVVEARVESANTGGLEVKVGNIRGFIPISQISEFRVETPADFVGQKLLCVVTEANPRRGNLVLSHRAVLEREKEAKRKERLEKLEVGQAHEGTVRKVADFGAFVDIGGLDGLVHVSQLSWDRVQHPSEVVKEGDKIQVRVEKVDKETGKIALSYRSMQDNPWSNIEAQFPIGSVARGKVTRLATFGAFVKLTTGVEGLVHISELANRRVSNVASVIDEGQEVDVKILSIDRGSQKIALSIRQATGKPESEAQTEETASEAAAVPAEPARASAVKKHQGPLKGGTDRSNGGEKFGLRW
jgi:small subunit ribosomal protein S1